MKVGGLTFSRSSLCGLRDLCEKMGEFFKPRALGTYKWDPEAVNEARIQEHWAQVEASLQQDHLV